jgi:folate-binding protein YgfZ
MAKPNNPAEKNTTKPTPTELSEPILNHGDSRVEAEHLRSRVGLVDLSNRDRLCLLGEDRHRFLNGQITNNIRDLRPGFGCYSLTVTNKGIILGDCTVYCLTDEILLDIEPNHGAALATRLSGNIVSDDVEIVDVAPHFGLVTIQGPLALRVLENTPFIDPSQLPTETYSIAQVSREGETEIYAAIHPRSGITGYDLFISSDRLKEIRTTLVSLVREHGGDVCGEESLETLRIEAGIPRFPIDMEPSILAPELRQEARTISYSKGCYVGQEVINRIKSIGKVKRGLVGITFDTSKPLNNLSGKFLYEKEKRVGFVTSVTYSEPAGQNIGLAIVKTVASEPGNRLMIADENLSNPTEATVTMLPFSAPNQTQ